jgi:orotate phosphoribosyltransferase
MTRAQLAASIQSVARLTGRFRLRSGQDATEYFDKYQLEARPELLRAVAEHLSPMVPASTEVLAGLELGGVPIATALSLRSGLPMVFVRKASKPYGTQRLAEGVEISDRRLLVIEDVVTTGGQIIASVQALRGGGARVEHALCVIDREMGGVQRLAQEGVELSALFVRSDFERAAGGTTP